MVKPHTDEQLLEAAWLARQPWRDDAETTVFRLLHGAGDGFEGLYADQLGDFVLLSSRPDWPKQRLRWVADWLMARGEYQGCYYRCWHKREREESPRLLCGQSAADVFWVKEWGQSYLLSVEEGYSYGLFLDQKDNRQSLLRGQLGDCVLPVGAGSEVLNVFAYTCSLSVAAAGGGAAVTSLDLSKKYLDWGKQNFVENGHAVEEHDFIFGDAFEWLRRLRNKGRSFDLVMVDPPTFSHSKKTKFFKVEKHYQKLALACVEVLSPGGWLFACTNSGKYPLPFFKNDLKAAVAQAGREVLHEVFVGQSADFPSNREEPPYLKTMWMQLQ